MEPCTQADHRHSGRPRRCDSRRRILEDEHFGRVHPQLARRVQIDVGMRLAARDVLGGAEQSVPEMVGEAEPLERPSQPARRAGRSHGLANRRKGIEECLDPGDGRHLFQPALELLAGPRLEVRRQIPADLRLDPCAGVRPVQPDIALDRLLRRRRMAQTGQRLRENGVGQYLAVDDNPVEIEDQRREPQ